MPKNDGHINAGRISKSRRLQIILDLLKKADHPLSAEEISKQAYEFGQSGRIMLNVSTNIGEMRSADNIADGYVISHASTWKSSRYSWHDGRPRYHLLAAPGWKPRWKIGPEGMLINAEGGMQNAELTEPQINTDKSEIKTDIRICQNEGCGNQVHEEESFCSLYCRTRFFERMKVGA